MNITIYYRKNLKLSKGKLASACSHVSASLLSQWKDNADWCNAEGHYYPEDTIIKVLMASDKKFEEFKYLKFKEEFTHLHVDEGLSEVAPDTQVAFGYIE